MTAEQEQQDAFAGSVRLALDQWPFEVIDDNPLHDPFEPDLVAIDQDEWVFTVVCQWIEDAGDGLEFFPGTFRKRKWIQDDDERPLYFALGVGGTPEDPEIMCFSRFFLYAREEWPASRLNETRVRRLCHSSLRQVVERDFERMYSPNRRSGPSSMVIYMTP